MNVLDMITEENCSSITFSLGMEVNGQKPIAIQEKKVSWENGVPYISASLFKDVPWGSSNLQFHDVKVSLKDMIIPRGKILSYKNTVTVYVDEQLKKLMED